MRLIEARRCAQACRAASSGVNHSTLHRVATPQTNSRRESTKPAGIRIVKPITIRVCGAAGSNAPHALRRASLALDMRRQVTQVSVPEADAS